MYTLGYMSVVRCAYLLLGRYVQYEVIYVVQEETRYSVGRGVDWYFLELVHT